MTEAGNKEFVYLRRHLPPAQAQRILAMNLPGVFEEKEYHRYYPAGEVAAHAVGFTNIDDHGQEGLELSFNDWLAGSPGRKKVLKNLYGEIVRDLMPVKEAEPGRNLDLSLDMRLQYLAYRELKSAIAIWAQRQARSYCSMSPPDRSLRWSTSHPITRTTGRTWTSARSGIGP